MLLIGLCVGISLIVSDIMTLYKFTDKCSGEKLFCACEVLDLCFLLPCTYQIILMMGHYDDRKQSRLKEIANEKAGLTEAYSDILGDLEGVLGTMSDSSAGLAEKNFATHRRDVIHFLEKCKKRFTECFVGSKIDEMRFLEQFRRLIRHWLKVFEEASIDPEGHPMLIEKFPNEFDLLKTLPELIDRVISRLNEAELRMVTDRQKNDNAEIDRFKQSLEGHKRNSMTLDVAIPGQQENALQASLRELRDMSGRNVVEATRCGWCECKAGCAYKKLGTTESFPILVGCGCIQMNILCREHGQMLFGILVGTALAIWNLVAPFVMKVGEDQASSFMKGAVWQAVPLLVYVASLTVLVAHIESICEILRLEREVANIKEEHKRLDVVKEQMHDFYDKVQEVIDLWLYRTIPRLDLYKEMNHFLEDSEPMMIINQIETVNKSIATLEANLGPLPVWKRRMLADAKDNSKKTLTEGVANIIRTTQTDSSLQSLLGVLGDELKQGGKLAISQVALPYNPGLKALPVGGSFATSATSQKPGGPVPVNVPGWPRVPSNQQTMELSSLKKEAP